VNPADVMLRDGRLREWYQDSEPPFIPGMDIAGTIDEIGDAVNAESGLAIGGDVVGIIDNHGQHGGYSECIVLDARSVRPKPARADFPEAASFLMNALTVRTALDALALPPGSTLLVTGAAGAFGGCAVQLGAPRNACMCAGAPR
jgi:NADPH2:quinone reductase